MKDEVKAVCLSFILPPSTSRSDVGAPGLDGELALRLLDGGRDFEAQLARGAVVVAVGRDVAHLVARAQVFDERVESLVQILWLVVEDFAARLFGEVVDAERADLEDLRDAGHRPHHAALHALPRALGDDAAHDAARLEDLALRRRARRAVGAVEVARHGPDEDYDAAADGVSGLLHVNPGLEEGFV